MIRKTGKHYRPLCIQTLARAFIVVSLMLPLGSHADLTADLDSVAKEMVALLKIPSRGSFSFSATEKDENYLIPVSSFYDLISKRIRRHNNRFLINVLDGENQRLVQSLYLKASAGGYEDVEIQEARVDSLIIGASLYISAKGRLYIQFGIYDLGGNARYKSSKIHVPPDERESRMLVDVLDLLEDEEEVEMLRFREKAIKKLNQNLFADPNMTADMNIFSFRKDWTYANLDQVDALEQILRTKFGFRFDPQSPDRIVVNRGGGLEFHKRGKRMEIPRLVEVEPVLDDDFKPEADSVFVPADELGTIYARIPITSGKDAQILAKIRQQIEVKLADAYKRHDFAYLEKVFASHNNSVLTGKVSSNPKTGKEFVRYYWMDKTKYINGLRRMVTKKKYRLHVDLKLLSIYQENANRYWAIAFQDWKTRKKNGAVAYKDNGFLFINFDFADNKNEPVFKIHYRIWIYNYRYGDPELKLTRADFIRRDFDGVFFPDHAKSLGGKGFYTPSGKSARKLKGLTISGIDRSILNQMRDDLIRVIQQQDTRITGD